MLTPGREVEYRSGLCTVGHGQNQRVTVPSRDQNVRGGHMRSRLSQRPGEWGAGASEPEQVEAKGRQGPRASAEDPAVTVSGTLHGGFMPHISHTGAFYPRQLLLPPATQGPHSHFFIVLGAALEWGVVVIECLPGRHRSPAPLLSI